MTISASEARQRLFPQRRPRTGAHQFQGRGCGAHVGRRLRLMAGDGVPAAFDDEHRLVYRANDTEVKILKARYHY